MIKCNKKNENVLVVGMKLEYFIFKGKCLLFLWAIAYSTNENKKFIKMKTKNLFDIELDISENVFFKNQEILVLDFLFNLYALFNVDEKYKDIIVYSYELGSFDGVVLLKYINEFLSLLDVNNVFLDVIYRNNTFYEIAIIFVINNVKKRILFRDFFKFTLVKFSKLSQIVLNKNDLGKIKKVSFRTLLQLTGQIAKYNCNYVIALYKIIFIIIKKIKRSCNININHHRSLSSLSFNIFKNKYKRNFRQLRNSSNFIKEIYDCLILSYRGGIIDIYKPFGKDIYSYDINGSYSASMMLPMPIGEPKLKIGNNFSLDSFFGFIHVTLYINNSYLPFIGLKNKDNANIYPYGSVTVVIFSEELKYAMAINNIKVIKVIKVVEFNKGKVFNKFVNKFYGLKEKSTNSIDKFIFKIILNSLYGRMGLKNKFDGVIMVKEDEIQEYEFLYDTSIISSFLNKTLVNVNNNFSHNILEESLLSKKAISLNYKLKKKTSNTFSAVHIASAITSYGRINIDKIKRILLKNKFRIFYSDTDSIFTNWCYKNFRILNLCVSNKKLGAIKVVNSKIKRGIFLSNKAYVLYLPTGVKSVISGAANVANNRIFFTKRMSDYFINRRKRKPLLVYHDNLVGKKIKSLSLTSQPTLLKFSFEYTKRVKLIVGHK